MTPLHSLLLTLLLATTTALPMTAMAQDSRAAEAEITLLLRGYHELPSKDALLKASPKAKEVLLQIAKQKDGLPLVTEHALGALALHWQAPEALKMYTSWLGTPSKRDAHFHTAALAIGTYYPKQAPGLLQAHLKSVDLQRRITVATALKMTGTPESRELLRAAAKAEKNPTLRATMEQAALEVR